MNIFRFTALLLLATLFVPTIASAHCNGKHTGDHPHCTGEPPDPPDTEDTIAHWSFDPLADIYEVQPARRCTVGFISSTGSNGHYQCEIEINMLPTDIYFQLPDGQPIGKKGKENGSPGDGYCQAGTLSSLSALTKYAYVWGTGDDSSACNSAEGCGVQVQNWFFGDDNRPEGTGLIIVEANGKVFNADGPNPFDDTEAHVIDILELFITFKQDGTNKTVQTCRWTENNLNFHSELAPPP